MRNIKFRAFDNENKEMLEVENLYFNDISNKVEIKTTIYSDYFNENEMILMQYTGLKDKNGKEIYEGDILKNEGKIGTVKYGKFNCSCCYGVYGWYIDTEYDFYLDIRDFEDDTVSIEVIGNIYEHPELLEIQN